MRGVSEETIQALRDAILLLQELVAPICRKHGLTLQQLYVLSELKSEPRQTATRVADRVGIQRTNFAAVWRKLEVMGLIAHEHGKLDKRKVYLDLTDKGTKACADIIAEAEIALSYDSHVMSEQDYIDITRGVASIRKLATKALALGKR